MGDDKIIWKIDEDSFDVNNAFCHGVLNVEIEYDEEKWYECYDFLKEYMKINDNKCPSPDWKIHDTIHIGSWLKWAAVRAAIQNRSSEMTRHRLHRNFYDPVDAHHTELYNLY